MNARIPATRDPLRARIAAQLSELCEREAIRTHDDAQASYLLSLSDRAHYRALGAGWVLGDDAWAEPLDPTALYMARRPYPTIVLVAMAEYGLTEDNAVAWQRGADYLIDSPSRELVVRVREDGETDSVDARDLEDALTVFAIRDADDRLGKESKTNKEASCYA